jgi:hypothetical protein
MPTIDTGDISIFATVWHLYISELLIWTNNNVIYSPSDFLNEFVWYYANNAKLILLAGNSATRIGSSVNSSDLNLYRPSLGIQPIHEENLQSSKRS